MVVDWSSASAWRPNMGSCAHSANILLRPNVKIFFGQTFGFGHFLSSYSSLAEGGDSATFICRQIGRGCNFYIHSTSSNDNRTCIPVRHFLRCGQSDIPVSAVAPLPSAVTLLLSVHPFHHNDELLQLFRWNRKVLPLLFVELSPYRMQHNLMLAADGVIQWMCNCGCRSDKPWKSEGCAVRVEHEADANRHYEAELHTGTHQTGMKVELCGLRVVWLQMALLVLHRIVSWANMLSKCVRQLLPKVSLHAKIYCI